MKNGTSYNNEISSIYTGVSWGFLLAFLSCSLCFCCVRGKDSLDHLCILKTIAALDCISWSQREAFESSDQTRSGGDCQGGHGGLIRHVKKLWQDLG